MVTINLAGIGPSELSSQDHFIRTWLALPKLFIGFMQTFTDVQGGMWEGSTPTQFCLALPVARMHSLSTFMDTCGWFQRLQ